MTDPAALLEAARRARTHAHAPYSGYAVGAAVQTEDGIFSGCNVENASYGLSLCAERAAVAAAVQAGRRRILAVAVAAAGEALPYPCGACRQVLAEFADPDTPVYLDGVAPGGTPFTSTLGALLPHAFALRRPEA